VARACAPAAAHGPALALATRAANREDIALTSPARTTIDDTATPPRAHVKALAVMMLVTLLALAVGASAASGAELLAPSSAPGGDAVASACPCSGPAFGGVWRNHGQYLSCVTRAARGAAKTAGLAKSDARQIVRDGARSSCGKPSRDPGNVRVCAQNPVLACPIVRTARVDDCTECEAALEGRLVRCARVAARSGATSDVCADAGRIRTLGGKILEQRTGVDCASCKAKLGTAAPEGLDCVAASCGGPSGS